MLCVKLTLIELFISSKYFSTVFLFLFGKFAVGNKVTFKWSLFFITTPGPKDYIFKNNIIIPAIMVHPTKEYLASWTARIFSLKKSISLNP